MEGNTYHNHDLGAWGEQHAADFLIEEGYTIIERNFRVRKAEVDIIATREIDGEKTICFIEVKTRSFGDGSAERATQGPNKLAKIQYAARCYLEQEGIEIGSVPIQFEHVSVYVRGGLPQCSVYVIPL